MRRLGENRGADGGIYFIWVCRRRESNEFVCKKLALSFRKICNQSHITARDLVGYNSITAVHQNRSFRLLELRASVLNRRTIMIKMANRSVSEESWVSHLGFIQGVITRMAQNSYLLKGWDVTLVAAVFALSLSLDSAILIGVALLPTLVFAFLDAYYLRLERLFRSLYKDVRENPQDIEAFSMDIEGYEEKSVKRLFWTVSIWPFYITVAIAIVSGIFLSASYG